MVAARHSLTQVSPAERLDRTEEGQATIGTTRRRVGPADGDSAEQGISNRPAREEHAFPSAGQSDSQEVPDSVEDGPKQVGGNRGRI